MMKYPRSYLDEIGQRLKVSDVVGSVVKLSKRGKEFVGLSPFTNEKTPSFTVNDEKGFYHCFSSGEHGGIFDFLVKVEKLTFGDAVRRLAAKAGMQEYKFTKTSIEQEKKIKRSEKIFQLFFSYCHKNLFIETHKNHLNYLIERSLSKSTIDFFQIGFCDDSNKARDHFLKLGYSEKEIIETGLFYQNDQNKTLVSRFKNRIIFPIKNLFGEFIGCGGRTVLSSVPAKYINSPETIFFKKGNNLYNFNNAKNENKNTDHILIVEGYMDVVSLYNSGIKNVCASLGTAITDSQISLAWRNFKNIIICFDGDSSGLAAAYRAAEKLIKISKASHSVSFVMMPQGLDPDDYVNKFGKEGFYKIVEKRKDIIEFLFDYNVRTLKDFSPSSLASLEKNLMNLSNTIEDVIIQKYYRNFFKNKIFENLIKKKGKEKLNRYQILNSFDLARLDMSEVEIRELSFCHLLIKFPHLASKMIEKISSINLSLDLTVNIKSKIIDILIDQPDLTTSEIVKSLETKKINKIENFLKFIKNNNLIESLDLDAFIEIVDDFEYQLNKIQKSKKIEELEKLLSTNMNEQAFTELISLKNNNNL